MTGGDFVAGQFASDVPTKPTAVYQMMGFVAKKSDECPISPRETHLHAFGLMGFTPGSPRRSAPR
jgi:hypothetical protein